MRTKGAFGKRETKNRVIFLRLTARQYALVKSLANANNLSASQILRKFVDDGLVSKKDVLEKIKCSAIYNIYKRNFLNSRSRSRSRASLKDKLHDNLLKEETVITPLSDTPITLKAHDDEKAYLDFLEKASKQPEPQHIKLYSQWDDKDEGEKK